MSPPKVRFQLLRDLRIRRADRPDLALRLWCLTWVLLALYLGALLRAGYPFRLDDPAWLEAIIAALINNGLLPLLALVFLNLAIVLKPASQRLRRRRRALSRLALVAALGFVLLIPLRMANHWLALQHARQPDGASTELMVLDAGLVLAPSCLALAAGFVVLGLGRTLKKRSGGPEAE